MKQVYQYSVIRFIPYPETGEFANIGILVYSPIDNFLEFKLIPIQCKRVVKFFDKLTLSSYKEALNLFNEKLNFIKAYTENLYYSDFLIYMNNILESKENLIQFSTIKTILYNKGDNILSYLYQRYIGRDFINKKNREYEMVVKLRQDLLQLKNSGIYYKKQKIEVGLKEVNLPFVAKLNSEFRAIKPLAFHQQQSTQLIEHGEKWLNRFKWLIKDHKIEPHNILLPIEAPTLKSTLRPAYDEVINEIKDTNIRIIDFKRNGKILEFAQYGT